jgi:LuxR family maltose regulon positive regulatory protein
MHQSSLVLSSRVRPPALRETSARRIRLLRTLDAVSSKAILVIAPAGFGKTTLLSSWMQTIGEAGAWVTLGPETNTLTGFLNHIAVALDLFSPETMATLRTRSSDSSSSSRAADMVLEGVERSDSIWMLVLDDFHLITDPEIHAFITRLIDVMNDGSRLVIASRSEAPIPVARLRLQGEMTLISAEDLRATPVECRAALAELGLELTPLQANAIARRTAGWMAALHLVAVAGRTRLVEEVIQLLEGFDAEFDLLADFLLQEILGQESTEMQEFLLRISILDRFTIDTCFAVTGNPSAGQLLDRARRNGLFLAELDDSRTWFRFHPLFREFLRRELNLRTDPEGVLRLHELACRWFVAHNMDDEALTHAVESRDWASATKMIKSVAFRLLFSSRVGEIFPLLENFPNEVILADPDLSSIAAYALVRQGRIGASSPYLEAAELGWNGSDSAVGLAVVELVRGSIARFREDGPRLFEHGLQSLALVTESAGEIGEDGIHFLRYSGTWLEPFPHLIPYLQMALGLMYQRRISDASRLAEEIRRYRLSESVDADARISTVLVGAARAAAGLLHDAEATLRPIVTIGDFDDIPAERSLAVLVLSEIMYAWDRLSESEDVLLEGIRSLAQSGVQILDAPLQMQLARTRWALGDLDGAFQALDAAEASAASLQNRARLLEVDAFRARIALALGDVDRCERWFVSQRSSAEQSDDRVPLQVHLVTARLHIANGDTEEAVVLLEGLGQTARENGATFDLIQILTLLSIAYLDLFELDQAVEVLRDALEIGEASGYIRVFVDEGAPMTRLLRIAHRRGVQVHYINTLLEASGQTPEKLTKFTHTDLVEPITARELEVLGLVALSLTNKEISDELYIAVSTVKRHITNLYGKLGVSSRTEAVQKARKLQLLSVNHSPSGMLIEAT